MRRSSHFPKLLVAVCGLVAVGLAAVSSASAATSAGADLQLTVSAAAQSSLGDTITYLTDVRNAGPANATSVRVTYQLPVQVQLVSASASQGICTPRGTTTAGPIPPQAAPVQCLLGPLEAGAQARVTIVARVTGAGTLTVKAAVSADQSDPNTQNNQAEVTTAIGQPPAPAPVADLQLSLAAPGQTNVGDSIRYVADVRNAGPGTARQVKLTAQLPAQARLLRMDARRGQCTSTATSAGTSSSSLSCSLGRLRSGDEVRLAFAVRSTAAGALTATATVSSDTSDPNSQNNTAQATTNVSSGSTTGGANASDLGLHLSGPAHARRGASIRYVATIFNRGPAQMATVALHSEVSSAGRAVSLSVSQGTCTSSVTTAPTAAGTGTVAKTPKVPLANPQVIVPARGVDCTLGALAPGARAFVTIVVQARMRGLLTVKASVSGDRTDPNPANNHASVTTRIGPKHHARRDRDDRSTTARATTARVVIVKRAVTTKRIVRVEHRHGHHGKHDAKAGRDN